MADLRNIYDPAEVRERASPLTWASVADRTNPSGGFAEKSVETPRSRRHFITRALTLGGIARTG